MCFFLFFSHILDPFRGPKKVNFRYRFEVPKSIDFGSIWGSKKGSVFGPLKVPNSMVFHCTNAKSENPPTPPIMEQPSMTRTGRAFKKKELATMVHIALLASDRFEGFFVFLNALLVFDFLQGGPNNVVLRIMS